eukprot:gene3786-4136_t
MASKRIFLETFGELLFDVSCYTVVAGHYRTPISIHKPQSINLAAIRESPNEILVQNVWSIDQRLVRDQALMTYALHAAAYSKMQYQFIAFSKSNLRQDAVAERGLRSELLHCLIRALFEIFQSLPNSSLESPHLYL